MATRVRLFALTCGWLTGPMGGFLAGETGRLRVPVPCYLIDHPRGLGGRRGRRDRRGKEHNRAAEPGRVDPAME